MRKERMQLELRPSKEMDLAASNDVNEHNIVRLPNRARVYYNPSESWDKIYVVIKGAAQKKLRIRQAFKKDIASIIDRAKLDSVGFVTTKTYKSITQGNAANNVWVSEDSENVVIGCDPEFVLVGDDGVAIYADTVFHNDSKWAKLGSDGPCAELRPDPSEDINVVIKNIKNLLTNNSSVIENFKWIGGASFKHPTMERRYTMGGHIHLGRPADIKKEGQDLISCQHAVGRILDEMVGVPMIRLDTPLPAERRKSYGHFGDLKSDNIKLEWRVPSGIWLVHPTLSAAVMSTTKAVAEEVWKRYKDRDLNDDFLLKKNVDDNIYKSFGCMNDETVRNTINSSKITDVSDDRINDFYGRYKKMSTYHKYKDNIDLFIKLCMSKKHPLSDKFLELRNGWLNNKQLPL
jgi:hypothetical protein